LRKLVWREYEKGKRVLAGLGRLKPNFSFGEAIF